MIIEELKGQFVRAGLKDEYAKMVAHINREPMHGDDFAAEVYLMRLNNDEQLPYVSRIISQLDPGEFFDDFNRLLVEYEAQGRYEDNETRIELLKEMLDYNYVKEYVVELACLYLEQDQNVKARRLIANAASGFDSFPEKDVLTEDIKNGTQQYKRYLRSTEKPAEQALNVPPTDKNASFLQERPLKQERPKQKRPPRQDNDKQFTPLLPIEVFQDESDIPELIRRKFEENHLVGMYKVKKQLAKLYHILQIEQKRREKNIGSAKKTDISFVLYGNPGTGKTTVARIIGDVLYSMGLIQTNTLYETDRSSFVSSAIGQTAETTTKILNDALGKTLFIDEAYSLFEESNERDFGKEAINTILKFVEDHRGELCVILAGYKGPMENMMKKVNKGFASRFQTKIEIEDYSNDELINILLAMAKKNNYLISADAKNAIVECIERNRIDDTFANARFMRQLLDQALEHMAERLVDVDDLSDNDLMYLLKEDFLATIDNHDETDYIAELNQMIGLDNVKKEVVELANSAKIATEKRRRGMEVSGVGTLHLVFSGNPGTGKTTVARLLGKIYNQLGILKREDVFVECNRSQLVGAYQGHTAKSVVNVVNSAKGGVLFIDEAYNLNNQYNDTFGMEAVNTLISEMENNRDNLVVILAGYSREMQKFMDTNPGIRSRISRVIEFEDYTLDNMIDIFILTMERKGYDISGLSREQISDLIDKYRHEKDFGNGRGVRNLCDRIIRRHNSRLAAPEDLGEIDDREFLTITDEDLDLTADEDHYE